MMEQSMEMKLRKPLEERLNEISKNLERFRNCTEHNAKYITHSHGVHWGMSLKPCSNCELEEYKEWGN